MVQKVERTVLGLLADVETQEVLRDGGVYWLDLRVAFAEVDHEGLLGRHVTAAGLPQRRPDRSFLARGMVLEASRADRRRERARRRAYWIRRVAVVGWFEAGGRVGQVMRGGRCFLDVGFGVAVGGFFELVELLLFHHYKLTLRMI